MQDYKVLVTTPDFVKISGDSECVLASIPLHCGEEYLLRPDTTSKQTWVSKSRRSLAPTDPRRLIQYDSSENSQYSLPHLSWLQFIGLSEDVNNDNQQSVNCSISSSKQKDCLLLIILRDIAEMEELVCNPQSLNGAMSNKPSRDSGIGVTSGEGTSSSNQSSPNGDTVVVKPTTVIKKEICYEASSLGPENSNTRVRRRVLHKCATCNKDFDRPSLLKRHERTHTGERPYVCEVCDKRFSTSSSLNTHQRIHTGERPHKCQVCGKRFAASSNLYYHRMTHTTEKPHKCSECSKSFPTPGDLRSHMYVHTEKWPFKCSLCSHRGFSKANSLRNHELLRHGGAKPHQCSICLKGFSLASNLRSHMKTHKHDDFKKCPQCGEEFPSKLLSTSQDHCYNCTARIYSPIPMKTHKAPSAVELKLQSPTPKVNFHSIADLASSSQLTSPPPNSVLNLKGKSCQDGSVFIPKLNFTDSEKSYNLTPNLVHPKNSHLICGSPPLSVPKFWPQLYPALPGGLDLFSHLQGLSSGNCPSSAVIRPMCLYPGLVPNEYLRQNTPLKQLPK